MKEKIQKLNQYKKMIAFILITLFLVNQISKVVYANEAISEESTNCNESLQEVIEGEESSDVNETETEITEEDDTIRVMGYREDDLIIPSISETYEANTSAKSSQDAVKAANTYTYVLNNSGDLPASYSSKDSLPPVRNQGSFGICWSFAALGAAEASMISKGLADKTIDLSELQLAYFFYHSAADPLGNTTGDKTQLLQGDYLNIGGNSVFTTFTLAGWVGAAKEEKAPYETASVSNPLNDSLAFDDDYHLQNAYWINMESDTQEVKRMIMQYGAVASAFYTDQTTTDEYTEYYNKDTFSYYYNGAYQTNHAITIAGWDDDYSSENFNLKNQPLGNGAWLVRNSWGNSMGDDGYFWISYEDTAFHSSSSKAFVFDFEEASLYDNNYQYDGTSGVNGYALNSSGSIANIFTASGNPEGEEEELSAVSFALFDVNVDYSIQIYNQLTDPTNPTSATALLASPKTGSTTYVGYYTIPLEESVILKEGEKFAVVVTLSKSNNSTTYFFGDSTYQNGNWIKFTNATQEGQSFRKMSADRSWKEGKNHKSSETCFGLYYE
ncbi:hypothetical protein CG709_02725 [Lachnotalea glycerini]|nr:hypothetical protein CG709_02725 [Lachnotalea glycerini]